MKLAICVNEGPYTHQASDTAYHFTKAALEKGHEVMRVFFYHDGVNNGTRMTVPPQDDRHLQKQWTALAEAHKLDLVVCVAAAQRRGDFRRRGPHASGGGLDGTAPWRAAGAAVCRPGGWRVANRAVRLAAPRAADKDR